MRRFGIILKIIIIFGIIIFSMGKSVEPEGWSIELLAEAFAMGVFFYGLISYYFMILGFFRKMDEEEKEKSIKKKGYYIETHYYSPLIEYILPMLLAIGIPAIIMSLVMEAMSAIASYMFPESIREYVYYGVMIIIYIIPFIRDIFILIRGGYSFLHKNKKVEFKTDFNNEKFIN